jgi:hypothetical protein
MLLDEPLFLMSVPSDSKGASTFLAGNHPEIIRNGK